MFLSIAPNISEDDPDLDYFLGETDGVPLAIRSVARRASARRNLAVLRREWQKKGALLAKEPGGEGSRRNSLIASVEFSLGSRRIHKSGKRLFSLLGQLPAGLTTDDLDVLLSDTGDDAADQLRQVGLLKDKGGRIDLLSPIRDVSRRQHRPDNETMKAWVSHYLSMITEEGQRIGKDGGGIAIRRIVPEMPNISAALPRPATILKVARRRSALWTVSGARCAIREFLVHRRLMPSNRSS